MSTEIRTLVYFGIKFTDKETLDKLSRMPHVIHPGDRKPVFGDLELLMDPMNRSYAVIGCCLFSATEGKEAEPNELEMVDFGFIEPWLKDEINDQYPEIYLMIKNTPFKVIMFQHYT